MKEIIIHFFITGTSLLGHFEKLSHFGTSMVGGCVALVLVLTLLQEH